ncbi:MAG: 7-cyano-7-deazaguanine synthase [Polyangia bacterium]|jgi:7-cyano-7-deazaguanine synthase
MASGGLDSTVLAYGMEAAGYFVVPVLFDYGQHAAAVELATARQVLPEAEIPRLQVVSIRDVFANSPSRLVREPDLWREKIVADDLLLPYRNLVLMSSAAAFAASVGIGAVFAAFINSNHAREIDATRAFLGGVEELLSEVGGIKFCTPFRDLTKREVAALGVAYGAPIASTFSCQANHQVHCGACPNCVDRLDALAAATGAR